jgi:hypothetical protein
VIVSQAVFDGFVTFMIIAVIVGWGCYDLIRLVRNWKRRREIHDEFFGYLIGLAIVSLGIVSLLNHHLSWW